MTVACDSNKFTRLLQERLWRHLLKHNKAEALSFVVLEFLLAAAPALSYLVYNVHIDKQSVEKADASSWSFWIMLLPLVVTLFEVIFYKRLMGIKMGRSLLLGQLLFTLVALLCLNEKLMVYLRQFSEMQLYAAGSLICLLVIFMYTHFGFSEMTSYKDTRFTSPCKVCTG